MKKQTANKNYEREFVPYEGDPEAEAWTLDEQVKKHARNIYPELYPVKSYEQALKDERDEYNDNERAASLAELIAAEANRKANSLRDEMVGSFKKPRTLELNKNTEMKESVGRSPQSIAEEVSQSESGDLKKSYEEELRDRAFANLKKQNILVGGSREGAMPPLKLWAEEVDRLREKDIADAKNKKEKEDKENDEFLNKKIEKEGYLRKLGLPDYSPEASEAAFELFPDLKKYIKPAPTPQIPFAPEGQFSTQIAPTPVEMEEADKVEAVPKQIPVQEEIKPQIDQQQIQAQIPQQAPQAVDIQNLLNQAKARESDAMLGKAFAQFRDAAIGMGLGREYKSDLGMYDAAIKGANKPLQDLLIKQQLTNEQAKNDPNSPISKMAQNAVVKAGLSDPASIVNIPYSQLEKLAPTVINSMTQSANAAVNALYKATAAQLKQQKDDEKIKREQAQRDQVRVDKRISELRKELKPKFKTWEESSQNLNKITDNFQKVKKGLITPGTADVSALYIMVKGLDPNNAVKEGEVRLTREALDLWGKMYTGIGGQLSGGDLLDPKTRESIVLILKKIEEVNRINFMKSKAAQIKEGVAQGFTDINTMNKTIYGDYDAMPYINETPKPTIESISDQLKKQQESLDNVTKRRRELEKKEAK